MKILHMGVKYGVFSILSSNFMCVCFLFQIPDCSYCCLYCRELHEADFVVHHDAEPFKG